MHRIDGEGATSEGKFTEGNPSTGAPATVVTADWLNSLQEEIISVLTEAGVTLNKASTTQLRDAILSLISGGGVAVTAAGVSIADAGDYFNDGNVEGGLQQLAQKVYAGTFNSGQIRRQVIGISGTAMLSALTHLENIVFSDAQTAATYTIRPDSEVNMPIGAAVTFLQAGSGKVTFVAGSGVTIIKPAQFNPRTLSAYASVVLYKTAPNIWYLGGMLEPAA